MYHNLHLGMTWEGFTRDVREGGQWGDKRVLNARRGVGVVDKERRAT